MNPPRLVFWETTGACNLACIHCRRPPRPAPDELSTAEAVGLVADIAGMRRPPGPGPLLVLSGGEPLLRGDLFEILGACRERGVMTSLATNGLLLDAGVARRLQAAGIRRVAVSLDASTAERHDAIRGYPGAWGAAVAAIARLREAGLPFQVNMTLTRRNAGDLEALHDLAANLGAAAFHLFLFVPVGCGLEVPVADRLTAAEAEAVLERFLALRARGRLSCKATCAPQFYRMLEERGEGRPGEGRPAGAGVGRGMLDAETRGCLAGTGVCFVSREGLVYPCGYLPVTAGSLRERPLSAIWEDAAVFGRLRDDSLLTGACGRCAYVVRCGGCRARAYAATGDFMGEEPDCVRSGGPA